MFNPPKRSTCQRQASVRSLAVLICVFILAGLSFAGAVRAGDFEEEASAFGMVIPKERKAAPDFTLNDMEGGSHSLRDYKGKVVFLHFWATWCGPCRKEMPMLNDLRSDLEEKGLKVIGVAVDRGSAKWTGKMVGKYIRKNGVAIDIWLDHDNDVRKVYDVSMLPTTYIIGRDGRFIGKIIGGRQWNSAKSNIFFKAFLD